MLLSWQDDKMLSTFFNARRASFTQGMFSNENLSGWAARMAGTGRFRGKFYGNFSGKTQEM
jgi:hypothetical protein